MVALDWLRHGVIGANSFVHVIPFSWLLCFPRQPVNLVLAALKADVPGTIEYQGYSA